MSSEIIVYSLSCHKPIHPIHIGLWLQMSTLLCCFQILVVTQHMPGIVYSSSGYISKYAKLIPLEFVVVSLTIRIPFEQVSYSCYSSKNHIPSLIHYWENEGEYLYWKLFFIHRIGVLFVILCNLNLMPNYLFVLVTLGIYISLLRMDLCFQASVVNDDEKSARILSYLVKQLKYN